MGDLRFMPPDGDVTDREFAVFFQKMMELQKRFKDGTVSPELTLDGLQNLIEGKYLRNDLPSLRTKMGIFKRFGKTINVWDNDFPLGRGPKDFFMDRYASMAEMAQEEEAKKIIPFFAITDFEYMQDTKLAPYRMLKKMKTGDLVMAIEDQKLFPKLTLGHIENLLARSCSRINTAECSLFMGSDGNYFILHDVNKEPWFLWVWLHNDGQWCYRFHQVKEHPDVIFDIGKARFWLLPEYGYGQYIGK